MKNGYGVGEIFKNVISLIYTKVFYKKARLIRRPIYVRGKKYLRYDIGLTTGYSCRLEMFDIGGSEDKKLIIGENCKIGDYVHIAVGEKVTIGDNCLMASKIYISDISHGDYSGIFEYSSPYTPPDNRKLCTKPVSIGNNVWIGENVCILPGVKIGDGCVIGANSVVNRDIAKNSVAVGSPARVVKVYSKEFMIWDKASEQL